MKTYKVWCPKYTDPEDETAEVLTITAKSAKQAAVIWSDITLIDSVDYALRDGLTVLVNAKSSSGEIEEVKLYAMYEMVVYAD